MSDSFQFPSYTKSKISMYADDQPERSYVNLADKIGNPISNVKNYTGGGFTGNELSKTSSGNSGMSLTTSPNMGLEDYSPAASGGGGDALGAGALGAAGGANPYVLGAMVGLSLMKQQAEDDRAKREKLASIEQNKGQNEANILNNMSNYYGKALLR